MSRIPDFSHNLSLRMCQVMDDIGVNEKIVMKIRKLMISIEPIEKLTDQLLGREMNTYYFDSQIEGTTTLGLKSDIDILSTLNSYNVIQDWSEWEQGKRNLLMIQDETVSPGYCLLQVLRDDASLPAEVEMNENIFRDDRGRILLKNTIFNVGIPQLEAHGPAQSGKGGPGISDVDYVAALPCQSYPVQARQWLDQHNDGNWLSNDMIQYCCNTGCFVVGVGNKGSVNENLEWRISTSLAERCFMFNLNITQIRCYVLMKLILKTFITPWYPESISSYMCKTVLFHCISNTRADEWKDSTLLVCVSFCLSSLYYCALNERCPHFFITENNLMMRRFSKETKSFIREALYNVILSNGRALLEIKCDFFGLLLQLRLSGSISTRNIHVSTYIAGHLVKNTAFVICDCFDRLLLTMKESTSRQAIRIISSFITGLLNAQHDQMHRETCNLTAQYLCHIMGTILASSNIDRRENLAYNALLFKSIGLNSDVASGKLKLASVFYCKGDIEWTELILKNIEECYDLNVVEPICRCYEFKHSPVRERFDSLCYESDDEYTLIKNNTAKCVRFLLCEVNCCPRELRNEMFRSTQEDLAYRTRKDDWMDMAVVDSLPFLYFLQYKTYSRLGKEEDKNRALLNLVRTMEKEPNLGHRETVLNLLGQCFENENRKDDALKYYMFSLDLRGRNNAARFLICMLLSTLIYGHAN